MNVEKSVNLWKLLNIIQTQALYVFCLFLNAIINIVENLIIKAKIVCLGFKPKHFRIVGADEATELSLCRFLVIITDFFTALYILLLILLLAPTNLFKKVVRPEEVRSSSAHDERAAVDVDHDGTLLLVDLGRVNVQVQAVLITHGLAGADVVLWANVAVVSGVVVLGENVGLDWWLKRNKRL